MKQQSRQHYNPHIAPFMEVVDKDNGLGYHVNIPGNGYIVTLPNSNTKVLYEIKNIENIKAIFIRYIHYDNKTELLNILAFCCQWWKNLKPDIIYYKEKARGNGAGVYLTQLGFLKKRIKNNLLPFTCNIDGAPCRCNVFEYYAYNIAGNVNNSKTSNQRQQVKRSAPRKNLGVKQASNVKNTSKTSAEQKPQQKKQSRKTPMGRGFLKQMRSRNANIS